MKIFMVCVISNETGPGAARMLLERVIRWWGV